MPKVRSIFDTFCPNGAQNHTVGQILKAPFPCQSFVLLNLRTPLLRGSGAVSPHSEGVSDPPTPAPTWPYAKPWQGPCSPLPDHPDACGQAPPRTKLKNILWETPVVVVVVVVSPKRLGGPISVIQQSSKSLNAILEPLIVVLMVLFFCSFHRHLQISGHERGGVPNKTLD